MAEERPKFDMKIAFATFLFVFGVHFIKNNTSNSHCALCCMHFPFHALPHSFSSIEWKWDDVYKWCCLHLFICSTLISLDLFHICERRPSTERHVIKSDSISFYFPHGKWDPKWSERVIHICRSCRVVWWLVYVCVCVWWLHCSENCWINKRGNQIDEIDCDVWRRSWMKDEENCLIRSIESSPVPISLPLSRNIQEKKNLQSVFSRYGWRISRLFFSFIIFGCDRYPLVYVVGRFIYEFFSSRLSGASASSSSSTPRIVLTQSTNT